MNRALFEKRYFVVLSGLRLSKYLRIFLCKWRNTDILMRSLRRVLVPYIPFPSSSDTIWNQDIHNECICRSS
ncbi:hypothetical protein A0128_17310 [Leptospira tipperaryensis]|uniref:Uncharacterized protein n=1 Tax=Leptospira tipperaryensis TaxID=2564040 RepID=A0A1D7V0T1_9LEPT|nr:hypothetical protein A0128_17310 [Leptospira tipperaryensis]